MILQIQLDFRFKGQDLIEFWIHTNYIYCFKFFIEKNRGILQV